MPKQSVLIDDTLLISLARNKIFKLLKKLGVTKDFKFIKNGKALSEVMEKKK